MGKRLDRKVAIITGGSRGIGRAAALRFAKEGARVCVNYSQDAKSAEEVAAKIRRLGSRAIVFRADVRDETMIRQMVVSTEEEIGPVDILVNSAGILQFGRTSDIEEARLNELFSVNVQGVINCVNAVQRGMTKRRRGKIVNIASIAGIGTSAEGTTPYAITKGALIILTKRLALELGRYGINVNAVAPGFLETDMTTRGRTREEFEEAAKAVRRNTILSRIGTAEDAANVILFLASDESSFFTGQIFTMDGGRKDFLSHSL